MIYTRCNTWHMLLYDMIWLIWYMKCDMIFIYRIADIWYYWYDIYDDILHNSYDIWHDIWYDVIWYIYDWYDICFMKHYIWCMIWLTRYMTYMMYSMRYNIGYMSWYIIDMIQPEYFTKYAISKALSMMHTTGFWLQISKLQLPNMRVGNI
jgi:hypothetical protein